MIRAHFALGPSLRLEWPIGLKRCWDTSALLTLRDDEPGADRVEEILESQARSVACFISRMEVLDHVWRDKGERAGRLAYKQLQALPINWGKRASHS